MKIIFVIGIILLSINAKAVSPWSGWGGKSYNHHTHNTEDYETLLSQKL